MSIAKATDVSYVIYQVTDLGKMEAFLRDFGLVTSGRSADALYMRGAGPVPYCHVSLLGAEDRFVGAGLLVGSKAELEALSRKEGKPIEAIDGPGGGLRVSLATPDGIRIDAVWGWNAEPLPLRDRNPFNSATGKERPNVSLRPKREPGLVLRMGHFVLRLPSHEATVAWFKDHFGLLPSDYMAFPGQEDKPFGTFLRVDLGKELVDHHSILITQTKDLGVHHCSFEMQDLDMLYGAHDYLMGLGYHFECGVGRHLLGSQIYDYWRDPFGFRVEHYTDGDVVNNEYVSQTFVGGGADETTQWGMKPPKEFFE